MKRIYRLLFVLALLVLPPIVQARSPQELLSGYQAEAQRRDPGFRASATRGQALYAAQRTHSNGATVSCSGCHGADPKGTGRTRANKVIEPMAIGVNPGRFSDPARVEKWFGRNCGDVLERPCTPAEKADFLAYLLSVK